MSRLGVSDHALLRFLDRGTDLDVEQLRERLARSFERAHAAATSIGAENYIVKANGLLYVVRADVLVTVLEDDHPGACARAVQFDPEAGR